MEVLSSQSHTPILFPNAGLLVTLEKDVKENKKHRNNRRDKFEHRDWIQGQVLDYLKGTPCVNISISKIKELKSKCVCVAKKNRNSSSEGKTADGFGLTEAETIQILNLMPTEPVEMHLVVEDLHARMTETKQGEFLDMVRSYNLSLANHSTSNTLKNHEVVDEPYNDNVVIKQEI